jgi:hypothetical protein
VTDPAGATATDDVIVVIAAAPVPEATVEEQPAEEDVVTPTA